MQHPTTNKETFTVTKPTRFVARQHAITPRALNALAAFGLLPQTLLDRHYACDWSELEPHDQQQNAWALLNGERILSRYTIQEQRFWILTERDRSVTTILLPSEY